MDSVHHDFNDDVHEICIWLYVGSHNSYWKLRKDQAFETGELGFKDWMKEDYELKNILSIKPGKAW